MCMGLASGYREPKEKLTVISCEKCGRSWQVTEAAAKHYNEYYKGVCADCRSEELLLKPYTNFNKIKDMSVEELAIFIDDVSCRCWKQACDKCPLYNKQQCNAFAIREWLERGADEYA